MMQIYGRLNHKVEIDKYDTYVLYIHLHAPQNEILAWNHPNTDKQFLVEGHII